MIIFNFWLVLLLTNIPTPQNLHKVSCLDDVLVKVQQAFLNTVCIVLLVRNIKIYLHETFLKVFTWIKWFNWVTAAFVKEINNGNSNVNCLKLIFFSGDYFFNCCDMPCFRVCRFCRYRIINIFYISVNKS